MKITTFVDANRNIHGYSAIKITGLAPQELISADERFAIRSISTSFRNMLEGFVALSSSDYGLELMFISEKINGQKNNSIKVFPYIVIRSSASSEQELQQKISVVMNLVEGNLKNARCSYQEIGDMSSTVGLINTSSVMSILKGETAYQNGYSSFDILNANSVDNMLSLFSTMSQFPNIAISFSIIPAQLTFDENLYLDNSINCIANLKHMNNIFNELPEERSLKYLIANRNSSFGAYSINVYGDAQGVTSVTAAVMALMKSGETNVASCNLKCFNVNERIALMNNELYQTLPWRMLDYNLNQCVNMNNYNGIPTREFKNRLPFLMTVEEMNVFFRIPLFYSSTAYLPRRVGPESDVEIPKDLLKSPKKNQVLIGVQGNTLTPVYLTLNDFKTHMAVVGSSGSGKTIFLFDLLYQFHKKNVPFLIIDPAKHEFRQLIHLIPDIQIFTPGNSEICPFAINPFIPPKGVPLSVYKPLIKKAMVDGLDLKDALNIITENAIERVYTQYHWNAGSCYGDSGVELFGFREFVRAFKQEMNLPGRQYDKETRNRLETAGLNRLVKFLDMPYADIFDISSTGVSFEDLLSKPTIIELDKLTDSEDQRFILALIIMIIRLIFDTRGNSENLKNILLIDEAHKVLEQIDETTGEVRPSKIVDVLASICKETRAQGLGLIVSEQSAKTLTSKILGNVDTRISLQLKEPRDREEFAENIGMNDYNREFINDLASGQLFFHKSTKPPMTDAAWLSAYDFSPMLGKKVEDCDLKNKMKYWDNKYNLLKPFKECRECCPTSKCNVKIKNASRTASKNLFYKLCEFKDSNTDEVITRFIKQFPIRLENEVDFQALDKTNRLKFVKCTTIMFYKLLEVERNKSFRADVKRAIADDQVKNFNDYYSKKGN